MTWCRPSAAPSPPSSTRSPPQPAADGRDAGPEKAQVELLRRFAAAPDGRLHKLEAHQIARQLAPDSHLVARLYRQDPPLLLAERDMRVLTDAGRAWLDQHAGTTGVSAPA